MLDTAIVTSRTGLTEQQVDAFARRYCPSGHKFRGYNFPTPDGQCPMCLTPELQDEIVQALTPEDQRDIERPALPAGVLATTASAPELPLPLRATYSERAARLRRVRRRTVDRAHLRRIRSSTT